MNTSRDDRPSSKRFRTLAAAKRASSIVVLRVLYRERDEVSIGICGIGAGKQKETRRVLRGGVCNRVEDLMAAHPFDYSLYLVTSRELLPPGKVKFWGNVTHVHTENKFRITLNLWKTFVIGKPSFN